MSSSLRPHGLQPARLLCPWTSPGKNTEVVSHSLLQGIFLTQGSNLGLLHCRRILYWLSHQGSPHIYTYTYIYKLFSRFFSIIDYHKILNMVPCCLFDICFVSVNPICCCSVVWLCPTLCNPMDCSTPSFSVFHYLLEFVQTCPLSR